MNKNMYLSKHIAAIHIVDFLVWGKNSQTTKILQNSLKKLNLQWIKWNTFQKDRKRVWKKSSVSNPDSPSSAIYIDLSKIDKNFCAQERQTLVNKFGTKAYDSWFQDVIFEESNQKELLLKAPSPFCADYIKINFSDVIPETFIKHDVRELKMT
jgi:hypothetical protein